MGENSITLKEGAAMPLGVSVVGNNYNFAVFLPQVSKCELVLYDLSDKSIFAKLSMIESQECPGVFTGKTERKLLPKEWGYLYVAGGKDFIDPYVKKVCGREVFGTREKTIGLFQEGDTESSGGKKFAWANDKSPRIPYRDLILYKLHVRGFSMKAPGVAHKGTFKGLAEKVGYLRDLGINGVLLMPCTEFDEFLVNETSPYTIPVVTEEMRTKGIFPEKQEEQYRINFWGYTKENCYFAPKASYAANPNDVSNEFKKMVKTLHTNGIEVLMEMNFNETDNPNMVLEALIWWVKEYHVDGFRINRNAVPDCMIALHPALSGVKFLSAGFDMNRIYAGGVQPKDTVLAEYHDGFQNDLRRFIKGDEEMVSRVADRIERQTGQSGIINYIADNNGMTLADLYSYDVKHNLANGEENRDGTDYNFSWNCGVEGKTKKAKTLRLRTQMKKNALAFLMLSQGTPMLLAGDEFGNTQEGNNNAYCQDNEIGWLSWKELRANQEIFQFVKQLIAFRKAHPVVHNPIELKGMDYISCGCPDKSRHGTKPWYPDYSNYSRTLALMLCGEYALLDRTTKDRSIYLAANMHWEPHRFDLPAVNSGYEWKLYLCTDNQQEKGKERSSGKAEVSMFEVPPRSVVLFVAEPVAEQCDSKKKRNSSVSNKSVVTANKH